MDKKFDLKLCKSYKELAERFNDNLSEDDCQAEKRRLNYLILDAYNSYDEQKGKYTANNYSRYVFENISKEFNIPLLELNIVFGNGLDLL